MKKAIAPGKIFKPVKLHLQFFAGSDELVKEMKDAVSALREHDERRENELKKFGEETAETKQKITELNNTIDEIQKKMDDIAAKANRSFQAGGEGQTEEQKAKSQAFYKFLRKGKAELNPEERKSLVADDEGHIIIPVELENEIIRALPDETIFRNLVNIRQTSTDKIRKRSMSEVTVGWGKIETSTTKKLADYESELTPADQFIYIENLNGLTKIGEDELEDSDLQLQQYLASSFALAAASEEDSAVLNGKGHAFGEPQGILTASNVERVQTAAAGAITGDDLISLIYALKKGFAKNASFVMPGHIEQIVRTLKNGNGDYIWQPALTMGTPNQLLGYSVYRQDDFGQLATGADQVVFGDYKRGYTLADRTGTSIKRLDELYINDGLIGFKFKKRVGGGVDRPDAFKVLQIK